VQTGETKSGEIFKNVKDDDTEKDDAKYHSKQFDNLEFWWDDEKGHFGLC